MKAVPGICDRCGQRYRLLELKEEYLIGRRTGLYTCPSCYDESHPQLDTRFVRTDDKQTVKNSRSDQPERDASRRLFGFNPVGGQATGYLEVQVGRVTVTT